jgi:ABC-type amino acid transport substrate-binding protein
MHTLVIAVLVTCAVANQLTFNARKLARFGAISVLLAVGIVAGTRGLLAVTMNNRYEKDVLLTEMRPLRDRGAASIFSLGQRPPPMPAVTTTVLDRVRERAVLRVGYFADSLPYVFVNRRGELVGFDVEMAMQLAQDLGVKAEFVPVDHTIIDAGLDASVCDLVMSGVAVTTERSMFVRFSASYVDETVAFVVPDHMLSAFSSWSSIREMGHLRLAVPGPLPYYMRKIREELPDVEMVPIERVDRMFQPGAPQVDAIAITAERGSAYTLLHPEYSVAVPKPRPFKVPLAYVIAGHDSAMAAAVDTWIDLKRKDGTIDDLFGHWILGQNAVPKRPRWSVLDALLHRAA